MNFNLNIVLAIVIILVLIFGCFNIFQTKENFDLDHIKLEDTDLSAGLAKPKGRSESIKVSNNIYEKGKNIGIGIENPLEKMELQGGNISLKSLPDNPSDLIFKSSETEMGRIYNTENGIQIKGNDPDQNVANLSINHNKFVGINNENPKEALDVNGSSLIGHENQQMKIGHVGHDSWAGIAHHKNADPKKYALLQDSNGTTILNSGNLVSVKIEDQDKMKFTNNKIDMLANTQVHGNLNHGIQKIFKYDPMTGRNIYQNFLGRFNVHSVVDLYIHSEGHGHDYSSHFKVLKAPGVNEKPVVETFAGAARQDNNGNLTIHYRNINNTDYELFFKDSIPSNNTTITYVSYIRTSHSSLVNPISQFNDTNIEECSYLTTRLQDGNVAIGKLTPTEKLDVVGTIKSSQNVVTPQVTSEKICTNSSQPKHNNSDGTPICLDNDDIVKLKNFSDGRQSFRIMGDGKKGESLFYNTQNSDGKRLVSTETNDHDDWKLTWAKTYDNPSSSTLTNTTWSQNIV